ncbi:Sialidase [Truncatella angustata]|uniref:Sialidase n=1 Tax=Truncatella angustata TaxID=152316 RepID=A0A9P8UZX6_9PEZI|nr:Sialidase [Truncatella angustata]KAH6660929.1 Sialidase [Truncatella angustata]KAH8194404.1 hypothetical protein TruAng_011437 [Truncatella angustata]
MLSNSVLKTAFGVLLSYLPSLASSRSIPISSRDVSTGALSKITPIKIETAQDSNNAYARATQLSDGSLLLGYAHFDGAARTIEVTRSNDGGKSFEPFGTIAHRDSNVDMDNTFLLEIGQTNPPTVLAAFRNHDKNDDGDYTWFRITVCISDDGGKNWEYASQAVDFSAESSRGMGVWEPFMRVGNDGKIQLTYSRELATDNQETFRTISENGKSWSTPVNLKVHKETETLRDGMQGIVKVHDAATEKEALVMVFETTSRGYHDFNIEYAVSYDDGATYGDRGVVYIPATGKQAGSPQIAAVGNNRLAVLFMTDESTTTQDWPNVAQVKSVISSEGLKDGKIEWSTTPQLIGDGDSHWPGLLRFDDKVMGMYDQDGVVEAKILNY